MSAPENPGRHDDPAGADPAGSGSVDDASVDDLPGDTGEPLDADEGEPAVEPFGGDDDIRSGQYGPGE
ncbi:hypothetical protein [uncultured Jatrophihabitans sp.]|uniref:hypothetical protein n=1 Tax=uncultured Jatrophihabitans sp. TaxID=1610747 RepID=UPI0035CC73F7